MAPGFSTLATLQALTVAGLTGANIADMTGGLCLYAQKHADGSTRASGANHRKFAFTRGILAPSRLSVGHREDATIDYQAVVVSTDGSTSPLTITDDIAVPAIVADGGRFCLGGFKIGTYTLTGVRQMTLDFGIDMVPEGADSDIYDTIASVREVNSRFTFRGINTQWLKSTAIPISGKAAVHADTILYLRKRDDAGIFISDATAEHIKMTAAGYAVVQNAFDASGNEAAECDLTLVTRYDGTNLPIVLTLGAAITA
jgi:hypothetical protein